MASTTTKDDTDAPRCPITGIARIRTGETLDMNNNNNDNNNNNNNNDNNNNNNNNNNVVKAVKVPYQGCKR